MSELWFGKFHQTHGAHTFITWVYIMGDERKYERCKTHKQPAKIYISQPELKKCRAVFALHFVLFPFFCFYNGDETSGLCIDTLDYNRFAVRFLFFNFFHNGNLHIFKNKKPEFFPAK